MKVTYLHQYFNTPGMPGGTRSFELARRLVKKGHEVNMITSWRQNDKIEDFVTDEDGIKVHWLPVPYSNKMCFNERIRAFTRFASGAAVRARQLEQIFWNLKQLLGLPGIHNQLKNGFLSESICASFLPRQ